MDKKSLKDVKRNNTAKVLEYILKQGPVSRIEIAEQSRFSPSTVSMAVSLLLKDGIVEEVREGVSTGGRKPILLQMKEDYGCIITVSVLRNGVNAEVFDLSGKRIAERTLISRYTSGNRLLKVIGGFVQEIQNGKTELPTRIIGLGLLCQDDLPEYDSDSVAAFTKTWEDLQLHVLINVSGETQTLALQENLQEAALENGLYTGEEEADLTEGNLTIPPYGIVFLRSGMK